MMHKIELFLFVLSIIYILGFVFGLILRLFEREPEPISLPKWEKLTHYLALTYIITYLLT